MTALDDTELSSEAAAPLLPDTPRKREAEEWALVLTAEGFAPRVHRVGARWTVVVEAGREPEARVILLSWQKERAERAARPPPPPVPTASAMETAAAYGLGLAMIAFHLRIESSGHQAALVDRGDSQAALVMSGQLERTITALTLHADLSHVVGNALFGGFFLAALSGRLGLGFALLSFIVSGALGNLANAVYYGAAHSSVGASTGVFGLVGVLAGLAAWQRHQRFPRRRGAWVAFGAGLGVVAMLGGPGPRVDFSAHLFGLAAGALTGIALALPLSSRPRPGTSAQVAAAAISAALVLGAWRMA